jgi:hypothetical protein
MVSSRAKARLERQKRAKNDQKRAFLMRFEAKNDAKRAVLRAMRA